MGRPVSPDREDKRAAILAAARRSFQRRGFHQTGVAEVCSEAGMSPGGLYRYFPSKDAIIVALIEEEQADVSAQITAVCEGADDVLGALLTLSRAAFEASLADDQKMSWWFEVLAEAGRNPAVADIVRRFNERNTAAVANALRRGRDQGQVRADVDLDAAALMLLAVANTMTDALWTQPDADRTAAVTLFLDMAERSLRPPLAEAAERRPGGSRRRTSSPPLRS